MIFSESAALVPGIKLNSTHFRESLRSEPPERLHHYTNQKGLLGIFETGEFWATKIQYMNDTTEFEYAINLAKQALNKRHSVIVGSIKNALIINSLERRQCEVLLSIIEYLDNLAGANICTVSFCADPDLLNQWRG